MGLDSPCVRIVMHWGPSETVEDYVQESGRSGRDGKPACALLLHARKDQQHTRKSMQNYYKNTSKCRRLQLFSEFDGTDNLSFPTSLCMCCDICRRKCMCGECDKSKILALVNL